MYQNELEPNSLVSGEEKTAPPSDALPRTHDRAMVALSFAVQWQSEVARHTDTLMANKMNLWRDIFPPQLASRMLDQPVGGQLQFQFAPGTLLPEYQVNDCVQAPDGAFNRYLRKCHIEPRSGRFYPRGFIAGVRGIFSEELQPFRVAKAAGAEGLTLELNHPLAGRTLDLQVGIRDIWAPREEHGGLCQDVAELVTQNGPGMQARWRGEATDFWADTPFARLDPAPDAEFYQQPRLVHHLDATARAQVGALYRRLLPQGGQVLDLMSSWTSHLDADLPLSGLIGLGMNQAELEANPLLTARIVQDLNADPRLPLADASCDAVINTVSVEYLTRPQEVFAEVRRVLRPGGRFILTFSNRYFAPKVIRVWQDSHEFERMGLVLEYFLQDGGFTSLETWSLRGLPRPADDKYAGQMAFSDPVYAVWGSKAR